MFCFGFLLVGCFSCAVFGPKNFSKDFNAFDKFIPLCCTQIVQMHVLIWSNLKSFSLPTWGRLLSIVVRIAILEGCLYL